MTDPPTPAQLAKYAEIDQQFKRLARLTACDAKRERVMPDAPKCLTDAHLKYLDTLRESAVTNMFGAAPYLVRKFPGLSLPDARAVLRHWMETFEHRHPVGS